MLKNKNVILGITASIAAYKSSFIVRELKKSGANVRVIQTDSSLDFVSPLTLSTLSENPVHNKMIDEDSKCWISHVDLGSWADLMLIAPATAKTMSKMVNGECDNLLLTTYLSAKCPIYIAPAMDLDMYNHPTTIDNIRKLEGFGHKVIPCEHGALASGLVGLGRMAEPENIKNYIIKDLSSNLILSRKKVLITAGPTYEPIDPVRFIGNYSSGKMGYYLAMNAANTGAEVILIMGPSNLKVIHSNVTQINVTTAEDMECQVRKYFDDTDIAILSAAVSDYKINNFYEQKLKNEKDKLKVEFKKTNDILLNLSKIKRKQILVGFALETENEIENAIQKLKKKKLDMIVLNSLNDKDTGFGYDTNKITIIDDQLQIKEFTLKHKSKVAHDIVNYIVEKL